MCHRRKSAGVGDYLESDSMRSSHRLNRKRPDDHRAATRNKATITRSAIGTVPLHETARKNHPEIFMYAGRVLLWRLEGHNTRTARKSTRNATTWTLSRKTSGDVGNDGRIWEIIIYCPGKQFITFTTSRPQMGIRHEQPIRSDDDIVEDVGLRRGNGIFIADVHTVEQQRTHLESERTTTKKTR